MHTLNANKTLHIVSFDIPYPPNYGGVIDIYFKIKALQEIGVKVILHTFLYGGKTASTELEKLCHKVYYYDRRRFSNPFAGELPYIVATRDDNRLLKNLEKDNFPILFEGLHTTYFLPHRALKNRFRIVRTHNVEHLYYRALEEAETGFFKKYFFRVESERLLQYEPVLENAGLIAAISPQETAHYSALFTHTTYLPAFHSNDKVLSQPGRGKFILYHGNLGVAENNKAALYLVHEVFSKLDMPCVIAGTNPSRQLVQAVKGNPYISLIDKISSEEILQLVQDAHINVLVTFQSTGIKLKLLNSLYRGRFCIVNPEMVDNTGLEKFCIKGVHAGAMVEQIKKYWKEDFTDELVQCRKAILESEFSNLENARKLADFITDPVTVQ